MAREKMLKKMYKLAVSLTKKYDRDVENKIWDMAWQYNDTHEDEIFVAEHWNDDDTELDGIYVEDDYFLFAE